MVIALEKERNKTILPYNGGIGKILPNAAEKLLDNDNRDKAANDRHPNRDGDRQIKGQEHTGNDGG